MILYSKLFSLILNLIIIGAVLLAIRNTDSLKGKFILGSVTVLIFVLPVFIRAAPVDGIWLTFYILKAGLGLFCLLYVRLKR
jgi:hypothetical protein